MTNIIIIFVNMIKPVIQQEKRVILVHWKNRPENPFEVFSNLKNFCLSYKSYSYNTLNNYLSKARTAFENGDIRVERKQVILRPKTGIPNQWTSKITPVVRRVKMKSANDDERDITYWLTRTPTERMQAVKLLNEQFYPKQKGMDKTLVVKRKMKP